MTRLPLLELNGHLPSPSQRFSSRRPVPTCMTPIAFRVAVIRRRDLAFVEPRTRPPTRPAISAPDGECRQYRKKKKDAEIAHAHIARDRPAWTGSHAIESKIQCAHFANSYTARPIIACAIR